MRALGVSMDEVASGLTAVAASCPRRENAAKGALAALRAKIAAA